MPLVKRTLVTFLKAELGFLGVCVFTCRHTPLFCGQPFKAGAFVFFFFSVLPNLINWLMVGILHYPFSVFSFLSCVLPFSFLSRAESGDTSSFNSNTSLTISMPA